MTKVMVFGAFDPLHGGHLNFFSQAKKLGDHLIVVVARDSNIRKIKNREPRVCEEDRLRAVLASKIPDRVVLGDEQDYGKVIKKFRADIIALGYDQKIPESLKNTLKQYKIVTLKAYKPEIYKSSKIYKK